jgi:UDP-glucuronate 4-epimerase
MKILVTGAAGFIGMTAALSLLGRGDSVVGLDDLNDYYDVQLKKDRLKNLEKFPEFRFERVDVADKDEVARIFASWNFDAVLHLAAQAGVRYSLTNPRAYVDSNVVGFLNILEGCRHSRTNHLVYASSSSVYGGNTKLPFSTADGVDHPVSMYAATKKANELMAHTYSHLFGIPTTGLRFFTVYGPWGRPDMALFLFTKAILEGRPIDVFNHGKMRRDFTYVDDIVSALIRIIDKPATSNETYSSETPDPSTSTAPFRIFNIGNHEPVALLDFIKSIEKALGKTAKLNMLPMQPGDVPATFADVKALQEWIGFTPATRIDDGVERFVSWYRDYFARRSDA